MGGCKIFFGLKQFHYIYIYIYRKLLNFILIILLSMIKIVIGNGIVHMKRYFHIMWPIAFQ